MRDFVKIYSTILDSSVWGESKDVKLLWVTMLLASDQHGRVRVAPQELAASAGLSEPECDAALGLLLAPNADGDVVLVKLPDGWQLAPGHWAFPAPPAWSRLAYADVYERDGWCCRYCGAIEDLSIDHVTPRCQGGGDEPENLVVACRSCNSRKGGRTPEQAGMVLR